MELYVTNKLAYYFSKVVTLSDTAIEALKEVEYSMLKLNKDEEFDYSKYSKNSLCIVKSGTIRSYFIYEERSFINWFKFEEDIFVMSSESMIANLDKETIAAVEPTDILIVELDEIDKLGAVFPELHTLLLKLQETNQKRLEKRLIELQFMSASQRYEHSIKEDPRLISKIPLGLIANYLMITQETLSRIRGSYLLR